MKRNISLIVIAVLIVFILAMLFSFAFPVASQDNNQSATYLVYMLFLPSLRKQCVMSECNDVIIPTQTPDAPPMYPGDGE